MSQLRAEILRAHKKKSHSSSTNINTSDTQLDTSTPQATISCSTNQSFEETDIVIANADEDIASATDWSNVINEWEELLSEEVLGEECDNFGNTEYEVDFLDIDAHPADNEAAKWRLHDLFLSSLPSLI